MAAAGLIKKRKVFYVMGFDPRGPDFYHALLRREGRLSGRRGLGHFEADKLVQEWEHGYASPCRSNDSPDIELNYEFLVINDIIAKYFRAPLAWCLWESLRMFLILIFSGFLFRNLRVAPFFALFTLYPFVMIILLGVLASLIGMPLANLILPDFPGNWLVPALPLFYAFCATLRRFDFSYVFYLIGDFSFSHAAVTHQHPGLLARIDAFADRVISVLQESKDDEEVVIVGHSSGGLLAIQLGAVISRRISQEQAARLSVLAMGNQASLGLCSNTERFLKDMVDLASKVSWCEVFAPQDLISSGYFNPLKQLPVKNVPPNPTMKMFSARLLRCFDPKKYARYRFKFFKVHLQYLRASETGRGFNYFALLIRPQRIETTLHEAKVANV